MVSRKTTAARALVDILEREQVNVVFGIPGGPVLPLYDLLADHPTIRLILVKHEQAAAYAAFAYARVTGRLGVCVATLGPGATNLLSGMPIALVASVPVLAITGQVQTTAYGKGAHQESTGWFRTPNQEAMFAATCKHTATCNDTARFPDFVRHSIRIATSGRPGPAHLIVPANLLHAKIDYTPLEPSQYRIPETHLCDDAAVARIAHFLDQSRFPLILVGERALLPDAGREIQAFSESFGIPVATDLSCKSIVDERSPMYLGCVGVLGHRAAERYLKQQCDLLLTVGQTFDEISTLSWDPAFVNGKALIQLDTDPEEIGKAYPVTMAAVGDLPTVMGRLTERMTDLANPQREERVTVVESLRKSFPLFDAPEMRSEATPLLPQRIIHELRQGMPEDALILADSSKWARWLGRFFQASRRCVVAAHDYEPMGWSVAGVLGAKLACPDRSVFCLCGDGAFLMSAMELSTAANYGVDVVWLVMNDSRLGIIYDLQKGLYGGRISSTEFSNPDFVSFASSFGVYAKVVDAPGQLTTELRKVSARGGPALFDIRFDRDEIPPVRPRSLLITRAMGLPTPTPGPEVTRALIKLLKEK